MLRFEVGDFPCAERAMLPVFLHAVVTFDRDCPTMNTFVRVESAHLPFVTNPSGFATKRHNKVWMIDGHKLAS